MQREAQSPNPWHPTVVLEQGRYYLIQLADEELPKVALLESWHGERPVFAFFDRTGDDGARGVSAVIIGETGDPFRGLDHDGGNTH